VAATDHREANALPGMAEPRIADFTKEQAAAGCKRRLQAELDRERIGRLAAGGTRLTYILCPEPPSKWRVSQVFAPSATSAETQSNWQAA
jgi:hypothetical protein